MNNKKANHPSASNKPTIEIKGLMMTRLLLLSCLFLTGCATGYQSGTFSPFGGYYDSPVNDKLQKVIFYGNGYTEVDTAVKYAMFQCAEIAEENNKPYFVIYSSLRQAAFGNPTIRPNSGSVGGKPAAFAYLLLSDEEVPGAIKTSTIIAELKEFKQRNKQASSANQNKKKSN